MEHVKIDLPDKFIFHCKIPVRITDINYGNHVGNDSLLSIIHESRVQFLAHYGCTELNVFGKGLIMANIIIIFKSESFYGDIFDIGIMPENFTRVSFDLIHCLSNVKTGKEIARAKTTMISYDYDKRKVVSLPGEFSSLFSLAL